MFYRQSSSLVTFMCQSRKKNRLSYITIRDRLLSAKNRFEDLTKYSPMSYLMAKAAYNQSHRTWSRTPYFYHIFGKSAISSNWLRWWPTIRLCFYVVRSKYPRVLLSWFGDQDKLCSHVHTWCAIPTMRYDFYKRRSSNLVQKSMPFHYSWTGIIFANISLVTII